MWPEDEPTAMPRPPDADPFDPTAPSYESVSLADVRESLLFEAAQRARRKAEAMKTSKPDKPSKPTNRQSLFDDQ